MYQSLVCGTENELKLTSLENLLLIVPCAQNTEGVGVVVDVISIPPSHLPTHTHPHFNNKFKSKLCQKKVEKIRLFTCAMSKKRISLVRIDNED